MANKENVTKVAKKMLSPKEKGIEERGKAAWNYLADRSGWKGDRYKLKKLPRGKGQAHIDENPTKKG